MPIATLPFGEGLERAQGKMIVNPVTFEDIRNVYLFDGKAQVRAGMTETDRLIDDVGVDLGIALALAPLRSENAALGVGQDTGNDEIWVNRLDVDGGNATNVGLYGTLDGGATFNPPIIIMADSDNKSFIAHDEPNSFSRMVTKYYDPSAFPALVALQADLDGLGLNDVFFRGVVRHLAYIFGWGFGTDTDPDLSHVVRVSNAGNPTVFQDDAFFEVGQRGEPVMVCRSAGSDTRSSLMVFKETETHEIYGYSPDTFGIRPADTEFGSVSSRLAISIGGTVFFWSVQGPRITTGGPSRDIAVPLDIDGPDPSTLVAESDVQDAFAEYDPATRVVQFVWGKRVYALSIRDPSRPRWSYYELAEVAQCGAQFFSTQSTAGSGGQPADGPEFDAVTPFPTITATTLELDWDNIGATGGEVIEIHMSDDGGSSYVKITEVIYNGAGSQLETIAGLSPITTYDFSLRYRRGGLYNPSATPAGKDPSTFPAAAQAAQATTIETPVPTVRGVNNGFWEPTGVGTQRITVGWTIPAGHEALQIEVERRIFEEGDTAVQDVDGLGIGPPNTSDTPGAYGALVTLPAGTTSYVDNAITNHRWHEYQFRFVGGTAYSAGLACWAGPDAPASGWSAIGQDPGNFFNVSWVNAAAPVGRTLCPGPTNPPQNHYTFGYTNNDTQSAGNNDWRAILPGEKRNPYATSGVMSVLEIPAAPGETATIGIRHEVDCFTTTYPSHWAPGTRTGLVGNVV